MPFVLAGVFIAITLTRVASLTAGIMGAGWLGWLFAAGLGFGVLLYAYWLRSKTLGGRAKVGLLFLVLVDGGFNLAEVYRHMIAQGTWNDGLLKAAGITYGIFPTLACLLLGWLAGGIRFCHPCQCDALRCCHASDYGLRRSWIQHCRRMAQMRRRDKESYRKVTQSPCNCRSQRSNTFVHAGTLSIAHRHLRDMREDALYIGRTSALACWRRLARSRDKGEEIRCRLFKPKAAAWACGSRMR